MTMGRDQKLMIDEAVEQDTFSASSIFQHIQMEQVH